MVDTTPPRRDHEFAGSRALEKHPAQEKTWQQDPSNGRGEDTSQRLSGHTFSNNRHVVDLLALTRLFDSNFEHLDLSSPQTI